ncbi:MAG: WhiB family transcriptional regulator [Actinomycetes bacterium]
MTTTDSGSFTADLLAGFVLADSWIAESSCRDLDTAFFFSDDLDDIGSAKLLCLSCPVRGRCLDAAVERGEQFGVWGGHLFVSGKIILSKRRKGRPPRKARPGDTMPEVEVPEIHRKLVAV